MKRILPNLQNQMEDISATKLELQLSGSSNIIILLMDIFNVLSNNVLDFILLIICIKFISFS